MMPRNRSYLWAVALFFMLASVSTAYHVQTVTVGTVAEGGGAITRLSGDQETTDTDGTISWNLTIPAATDVAVVACAGVHGAAGRFDGASPTINSASPTGSVTYDDTIYEPGGAVWYWVSPSTGSQTFAASMNTNLDSGIQCYAAYYENATGVRDSAASHTTGDTQQDSVTLTTVSGDMVVGIGVSTDYNHGAIVDENSQTEIAEMTHDLDSDGSYMSSGLAQIAATGASQTFSGTGDNITVCAIVLQ